MEPDQRRRDVKIPRMHSCVTGVDTEFGDVLTVSETQARTMTVSIMLWCTKINNKPKANTVKN